MDGNYSVAPVSPRVAFLRSLFDTAGQGLEIGPLHNPIAPKREGFRVEIVDHATAQDLRIKYQGHALVDPTIIEDVDYVWAGGPLADLIPASGSYDWIVASHVIEHIPNPVGFLTDCEKLLRPGGRLVLAVPDHRKCFDAFRPVSTLGQIVAAHTEHRTRHTGAALFDSEAYKATLSGRYDWTDYDRETPDLIGTPEDAASFLDAANSSESYTDAHGWVFTPSSFRFIMTGLVSLGHLHLKEVVFSGSVECEFFMSLATDGVGCRLSLQELARASMEEASRHEVAILHERLRALEGSRSWRMTAPLRTIRIALRRFGL